MEKELEGIVGALAFSPTPENELEFDEKTYVAQRIISPEEFGKEYLIEKMLSKDIRDAIEEDRNSRNSGMDR